VPGKKSVIGGRFKGKRARMIECLPVVYALRILPLSSEAYKREKEETVDIEEAFHPETFNLTKKKKNHEGKVLAEKSSGRESFGGSLVSFPGFSLSNL